MKKTIGTTMKIFVAIAAISVIVFISCGKQSTNSTETTMTNSTSKFSMINNLTAPNPFNKNVGAPIDGRVGDRWIANFKKKYGYNKSYILNTAYLQTIVNQKNCVGVCIYYGVNKNNNSTHILPFGVDINGKLMKAISVNTMQGNISWETSQQWISHYIGNIKSHFFGSNTFDRLSNTPCQNIQVYFAIDDKNKPQLLLYNPCALNIAKQYEDDSNTDTPKP